MIRPERLANLIEDSRVVKTKLCEEIGISVMTLNNFLNKGSEIGSNKLEKLADKFRVPIDYLFDREIEIDAKYQKDNSDQSGSANLTECMNEIKHLKELLAEKERTILILMKQLQITG